MAADSCAEEGVAAWNIFLRDVDNRVSGKLDGEDQAPYRAEVVALQHPLLVLQLIAQSKVHSSRRARLLGRESARWHRSAVRRVELLVQNEAVVRISDHVRFKSPFNIPWCGPSCECQGSI